MNYLQIAVAVLSIVSGLLSFCVLFLQAYFIRALQNKYDNLNREMRNVFGWDSNDWSSNFRRTKDNARNAHDKVKELMQLPLIKAAIEEQQMQELLKQEENVKNEIERLKKGGK